jgi:hypothetical protein
LSASGSGSNIAISVGFGTNIGEAFNEMAGNLLGAAGEDVSTVSRSPSTSSLTLTLGEGNTSRGAVTIDGSDGSMALGNSIPIPSGVGSATCSKSVAVWNAAGTAGISGTNIGEAFDKMAGDLMGEVGGDVSIVFGPPSTSCLTLTLGEGNTSGGL